VHMHAPCLIDTALAGKSVLHSSFCLSKSISELYVVASEFWMHDPRTQSCPLPSSQRRMACITVHCSTTRITLDLKPKEYSLPCCCKRSLSWFCGTLMKELSPMRLFLSSSNVLSWGAFHVSCVTIMTIGETAWLTLCCFTCNLEL
jgi:hypothetical protein